MRIGIDARLINETGVGRYIRNLVEELGKIDSTNQYILYLTEKSFDTFVLPSAGRWEKRLAPFKWHTLSEQVYMPLYYLRDKLDLLHVPYFTIPLGYFRPFIVTIHDLTILHMPTGKATQLPRIVYWLKYIGYWMLLRLGLPRAKAIIVPSHATKEEIINHFHISGDAIHVTYEGVDQHIFQKSTKHQKPVVSMPYFLYVGNAYPHKNLLLLVQAFADFCKKEDQSGTYKLVFAGKQDVFYDRLWREIETIGIRSQVVYTKQVSDDVLRNLYMHAKAFIYPSYMEGFGLPALEALSVGTPVVCSDIPVFREILGSVPYYIDPFGVASLSCMLSRIVRISKDEKKNKQKQAALLIKKYSWEQMGRTTLALYSKIGKEMNL